MPIPLIKTNFTAGEVSPSLFGHVDLARYAAACSTLRNFYVSYRGGAYSRAGTLFCGYSKQTGRAFPPRLISFQFSIDQGLALEFGNFYMRVIFDGSFVLEPGLGITGITQANPGVITVSAFTIASATANNAAVSASYSPNDTITLTGGTFTSAAVLEVITTGVAIAPAVSNPGSTATGHIGYVPGDNITLAGGITTVQPVVTVATTQVIGLTLSDPGTGGTPGTATVTGVSGVGTKFTANVTINGSGNISAVNSITTNGSYTVNPTLTFGEYLEPVTGGGLTNASLFLAMGVSTVLVANPGVFTANAAGGNFTQASTTGAGKFATFTGALFGPSQLTVQTMGVYSVAPTNPVAQGSSSGSGLGATFNVTFAAASGFNTGDWVFLQGIGGMIPLNGNVYVITSLSSTTFSLADVFGNVINTSGFPAYTSGGIASRIYTLTTPYAEADLPWLKFTQSADVMSLCCVNQTSLVEYAPVDLERLADDNWVFTPAVPGPSIAPPTGLTGNSSTSGSWDYAYEVTAIAADGTESIASNIAYIDSAVDITATAGSIILTWNPVPGNFGYYVYKAAPAFNGQPPPGCQFGFAGQTLSTQFNDSNITADFQQVPNTAQNPFVNGQILGINETAGGTGSTNASVSITTTSGSGFAATPVILSGVIISWIIVNNGQNYGPNDTAVVTANGTGPFTANITIGPQSGNFPSLPAYFQQRRMYANTINNPDTYYFSQPGAFLNFNFRIPAIATDAITGTPWGVEVNGIQWAIQTSGGLLVMTGQAAWLLVGAGSFATNVQPISPLSQDAVPQAFNGVSPLVPPVRVNYDVLYVDPTNSYYYDLPYQLYTLTEPIDLTELSKHLFTNYTIKEHAYAQEPNKILWAIRNDGILLSLTYYKTQQISGWARHDTAGYFDSVCSIKELPVDAVYLATNRNFNGNQAYMIERMNDRQWTNIEDAWCVDSALEYPLTEPAATVSASSATGLGAISGYTGLVGGIGYSAGTTFTVVDNNGEGPGTGAVVTGTIASGVVTALTIGVAGSGYINPQIFANDLEGSAGGSGFSAKLTLNNATTFTATVGAPFISGNVGSYLRMGGGVAVITTFTSTTVLVGNMLTPITTLIPGTSAPAPQTSGNWSLTAPITVVSGLDHLDGATVTGLADGLVIPPTTVVNGSITLATPASRIIIGVAFTAQLQTVKLDAGSPTVQGQRKKVAAATIRVDASGEFLSGENETDGSTLNPIQIAPQWNNLNVVPNKATPNYNNPALPLYTGDVRVKLASNFATAGQVAIEQKKPLPVGILALIPELLPGDTPDIKEREKEKGR